MNQVCIESRAHQYGAGDHRFANVAQLHRVRAPLGMREQLTWSAEPINEVWSHPYDANLLLFGRDKGGDENKQIWLRNLAAGEERDLYKHLGLPYIPPELREDWGEIQEALAECKKTPFANDGADNYNLGLMIIFLCEMEDESNRSLITQMLGELVRRQKQNGGWGYPGAQAGDTSQTQYAVLAIWMAQRHKYDVALPVIENVMNWILRTQDPSGAWGYQAVDPGQNAPRTGQTPLTVSLTSAALGSLYILTDLVNLPGGPIVPEDRPVSKLPLDQRPRNWPDFTLKARASRRAFTR